MNNKIIIGMIHLKALPTSPKSKISMDEIYDFALQDLIALENGGVTHAIVENFFDTPYSTNISTETLVAYTSLFTRLKQNTSLSLGVNIHACCTDEEMIVASLCGADFIRAESYVESRHTSGGILKPMAPMLTRSRTKLNSQVKISADINVKESFEFSPQTPEEAINDAIKAMADAIIITGFETGKAPSAEDAKLLKPFIGDVPMLIGSGVSSSNIKNLLNYADGVIVGSSIKKDNILENNVDKTLVSNLVTSSK